MLWLPAIPNTFNYINENSPSKAQSDILIRKRKVHYVAVILTA